MCSRTPDGFPYWNTQKDAVNNWGMLRDTSSTAYMGLFYADLPGVSPAQAQTARCFAKNVVEYILGNNRLNQSYIVGYTRYAFRQTLPRSAVYPPYVPKSCTYRSLFKGSVSSRRKQDEFSYVR